MSTSAPEVAVVTGATGGIGRAIALELAERGTAVCLVGRREDALRQVAAEAASASPRVETCKADLEVDGELAQLATRVEEEFGRADVLVHSAGAISLGPVESAPVEDLDEQFRVNVRAPYLLTQLLLPLLKRSKGQIVFVNSSAGATEARANVSQYAATKHALKAVADSLREEVNADGVRVISVFPGRTATEMQSRVHRHEGRSYRPETLMQPEDVAVVVADALALPRTAEVTDIRIRPAKNWASPAGGSRP